MLTGTASIHILVSCASIETFSPASFGVTRQQHRLIDLFLMLGAARLPQNEVIRSSTYVFIVIFDLTSLRLHPCTNETTSTSGAIFPTLVGSQFVPLPTPPASKTHDSNNGCSAKSDRPIHIHPLIPTLLPLGLYLRRPHVRRGFLVRVRVRVRRRVPVFAITLDPITDAASILHSQRHRRQNRLFDFLFGERPSSGSSSGSGSGSDSSGSAPTRSSRKDRHLHSLFWPFRFFSFQPCLAGPLPSPALPPFPYDMSTRSKQAASRPTPATPRVVSPSPTPSELQEAAAASSQDGYAGPTTRSVARRRKATSHPVEEREGDEDEDSDPVELRRARTRSRSPMEMRKIAPMTTSGKSKSPVLPSEPIPSAVGVGIAAPNGSTKASALPTKTNGHLAVPSAAPSGWSWRDFSRSPSPLGLIPIHRKWRTFVHRHEVPRKVLHVSIGFFTIWLYVSGTRTVAVAPWLMAALIPIAATDYLRHHFAGFNRFYVSVLGALMRESEYAGYNGVIFYLLGAWIVLYFFPKDVGVMGVLLLSWCDTAASTFGRLWGCYTPRIRRGKSLAGSLAAFLVGVGSSAFFWGWLAPTIGPMPGDETFMFRNVLRLPEVASHALGLSGAQAAITGSLALAVVSIWSGFVAAASEVVDLFGWDDNLTIPVLSGLGIWGFLKLFG
ncbi:hypothetical protein SODALDRAFT_354579 [Sodiomyces alkalinus F11]|uniref:Phosphatidate cytidylyltransferase n=1 Tax=Sodiomyces alkalinus (strain CBS 110278 / VKM F-3762 / F11) TaxID=1314773 RepID=A0A3N2Q6Z6_SODAK|nr:hypothetical protein SODALDRAFT_354579 [Sodiomyces alkalinus F11]ROT42428.1 hypothetical protein SODALDRAFT_354579 [Sodiomyces alkalinus F11]